jgi:hypothetical protein
MNRYCSSSQVVLPSTLMVVLGRIDLFGLINLRGCPEDSKLQHAFTDVNGLIYDSWSLGNSTPTARVTHHSCTAT